MFEFGLRLMVVFKAQLEYDLRFPTHPFLRSLAATHELVVNLFTPNTYCHIKAFIVLSYSFRVEPEVSTFLQYYKIIPKPKGCFYFFGPRGTTTLKFQFVFQCPGSSKG